jgi:glycosyltransferase involved in cell wall biosynthesis
MTRRRLGVLASHPIQYHAPLFRELAGRIDLKVYFAHRQSPQGQADAGFGIAFDWDIDLFEGYSHAFLPNVARHPDVGRFFGCDTPSIAGEIREGRFDAFLVSGWNLRSYWQAVRACRAMTVPVMVRGDSTLARSKGALRVFAKRVLYPAVLRRFDAHLYVGQRNREYLEHFGVRSEKLFFSPHCVDNARFAAAAGVARPAAVREAFKAFGDRKVVLFVGKLIPIKRPEDLVQAAHLLKQRGREVALAFAGDGPLRPGLEALCARLAVPATFLGFRNQSELPGIYASADLLALPSRSESWGLVVNEALAAGTRVVASVAVGCAPDLLQDPRVGRTYAVGDAAALAAEVGALLAKPPDPIAISETVERYSVSAAADGVIQAMDALRGALK